MSSSRNPAGSEGEAGVQRLNLTLESKVESTDLAESLVVAFAERAGYGRHQCEEIGLAVRESAANAIFHGNRCDVNKKVFLTAETQSQGLVISIRDEGEGFDPASLPDPLAPENIARESGRGFLLVRASMDEVRLRRVAAGGMELTMVKYLKLSFPKEAHRKMSLKIGARKVDGVTVLDLSGRLVLGEESAALRDTLKDVAGKGQKKILLNLADVSYIDSSGLGALVSGYTTFTSNQGQLKLLNLTKKIHDLLQITKLLTVFEVYNDEKTAISSFS
jgi:anti-sigma B factor antagonist